MPKISVVLPAYNAGRSIAPAIESIRCQTAHDWELIVVDNGSTDDTRQAATAAAGADPRVIVRSEPRRGIVAALNCGIAAARGEYIARMDADDTAMPERLAAQAALLDADHTLGLTSCVVEFGGDRTLNAGYALHVDWLNSLVAPEQIALNRFVESPLAHPTVMFRRELATRLGGYSDGDFPEDYELWLRWLNDGVRMAKVPRALLRWNDPPDRLSRSDPRYSPEAFFKLKAKWIARFLQQDELRARRRIWIWGAGRPTRKRAGHLTEHGVSIVGYVDVDSKKIGGRIDGCPVIGPDDLPDPREAFVLGYVSSRGARELIRRALLDHDYAEGEDFLMCA